MKTRSPAVLKWTHRISAPQTRSGNKAHVQYLLRQLKKAHDAELAVGHIRYMQRGQAVPGALLATNIAGGDAAVIAAVQQARSPVWRAVISLREEDAQLLGLHGIEEWHAAAHKAAERFREVLGIPPEGFCYAAAYHDPEPKNGVRHPHVHIDLWSTTYERPVWMPRSEFRAARRVIADLFHGPARDGAAKSRTEARDAIIQAVEAVVDAGALSTLAAVMPGSGRVAYGYMPAEVKLLTDQVVAGILADDRLAVLYQQYLDATRYLTEIYSRQEGAIAAAVNRARADLSRRIANVVLRMAADPKARARLRLRDPSQGSLQSGSALPSGGGRAGRSGIDGGRQQAGALSQDPPLGGSALPSGGRESSRSSPGLAGQSGPSGGPSAPASSAPPSLAVVGDGDPRASLGPVMPLVMAVARGLDASTRQDRRITDATRRRRVRKRKYDEDRQMT